jgi:hypothetical protein
MQKQKHAIFVRRTISDNALWQGPHPDWPSSLPARRPSGAPSIFPPDCYAVKFTRYYHEMRKRPDRAVIGQECVQQAVDHPIRQVVQLDGRIRRWAAIAAMGGRYLRVVLLPDGETLHSAFFDRSFKP